MARNFAAENTRRSALAKLVKRAKAQGISSKAIPSYVRGELDRAASTGSMPPDVIAAARRQLRRLGSEASKLTTPAARGHAKKATESVRVLRARGGGASPRTVKAATKKAGFSVERQNKAAAAARRTRRTESLTARTKQVVSDVRGGRSLTAASRRAGISPKTVRRYARFGFTGTEFTVITAAEIAATDLFYPPDVGNVFGWSDAVSAALTQGSPAPLRRWRGVRVHGASGNVHTLNTDFDFLRTLYLSYQDDPHDWARYNPFRGVGMAGAYRYAA
jgi:DNA-binding NarL/FixJ family response regulator